MDYDSFLEEFKKILKKNSLKFTSQRETVVKVLYNNQHNHFTPEELHRKIKLKYPKTKIGIATVYRTLNLLESENLANSISFGSGGKKYELDIREHHDHMICLECGKIIEFNDEQIETRQEEICKKENFLLKNHSMQLYGVCKECQNKTKHS